MSPGSQARHASPQSRRDRWAAAGLAALAIAYLYAGRQYALDTLAAPGPGVLPLAAGLALLVLAGCQLIATGQRGSGAPRSPDAGVESGDGPDLPRAAEPANAGAAWVRPRAPLLMSALMIVYAASVGMLGFLSASGALVVLASKLMGVHGWWRPVLLALGVIVATHVIFVVWLGVPLPRGLLG